MTAPISPTGRRPGPLEASLEQKSPHRTLSIEQLTQMRDSVVTAEAQRQGVPPNIALAVSRVENNRGIPWVVSPTGDIGLMQINPKAHPEQPPDSLAQPGINARVGVGVLAEYKRRYGTWDRALMAYNGALHKPHAGAAYVKLVKAELARMGGQDAQGTRTEVSSAGSLPPE